MARLSTASVFLGVLATLGCTHPSPTIAPAARPPRTDVAPAEAAASVTASSAVPAPPAPASSSPGLVQEPRPPDPPSPNVCSQTTPLAGNTDGFLPGVWDEPCTLPRGPDGRLVVGPTQIVSCIRFPLCRADEICVGVGSVKAKPTKVWPRPDVLAPTPMAACYEVPRACAPSATAECIQASLGITCSRGYYFAYAPPSTSGSIDSALERSSPNSKRGFAECLGIR